MLQGTAKQIAWANDIQESFLADVAGLPVPAGMLPEYQRRAGMLLDSQVEAKWWIEHRGLDARHVLRTRAERLGRQKFGADNWTPERGIAEA